MTEKLYMIRVWLVDGTVIEIPDAAVDECSRLVDKVKACQDGEFVLIEDPRIDYWIHVRVERIMEIECIPMEILEKGRER